MKSAILYFTLLLMKILLVLGFDILGIQVFDVRKGGRKARMRHRIILEIVDRWARI